MKKLGLLLILICLVCTACNGTVTRNIRHTGFTVSGKFTCKRFFPQKKENNPIEKITYFTNTHIINSEGKIYEVSLDKKYTNNENCKETDTSIRVKAIMNDEIVKATDGSYYYLTKRDNVEQYSKVPTTDNNYGIYDILLRDEDVVKVITADGSVGLHYVLKTDGNVYANVVISPDRKAPPQLMSTQIVYSRAEYGSRIVDFNYEGDSLATFVKTEDKLYRMRVTNSKECNKYADVECIYEMQEDEVLMKYKDRIIAYNGGVLITNYNQVFKVSS